ncbi:uncharacterized protein LOC131428120 isoform X1 [Malaya genurostris]|uniref:uncharacterized protein LOC131428120 isoform X1 n=1 Tax=Malaya genurostris TaxID=325434 RepID=UPI0026F3D0E8|nr:uncharacterized protein LOC131428120 isoform X1 [Malaya genurostris]XP_058447778.1 uncharacterized protein LOC131428120 isoform X1 [Malaya genurostris]XP_058447779.1 uncharacterized protein LOC131428120 isoform X1 [Malaya genurostris]XP_058447780.1 uncharacterized protein LOC131428120 isoform X1 [Malaya genurostris]
MKKVSEISAFPEGADDSCSQERREGVEKLLKLSENDAQLTVDSIECLPGSQQGDNYMSIIKRILVRGKRRKWNGKCKDFFVSLIYKRQITSLQRRKLFRADEAFANEINAYTQLVPVLRKFSRDRLPFPSCIYAGTDTDGDLIVLQDLWRSGYRMEDRRKSLSYRQCRTVVRELANFHAVSLAMKQVQPVLFHTMKEKVTEIVYNDEAAEFYKHSLETSLRGTLDSLHYSNKNGNLDVPIKAIERLSGRLYSIMSSMVRNSHEPWNVLCHGDTWVNNLMFNGSHEHVKLIDLQTMRYTSPVIDIIHLLYTSAGFDLRVNFTDELIRSYQESLIDALRLYVPDQKRFVLPALEAMFSYENIRAEYDSRILYGLGIAMWLLPAVTFHPDHIPDLDTVTMNDFKTKNHEKTIAQMLSPDYHTRMRDTVLEFYENGFLDDL